MKKRLFFLVGLIALNIGNPVKANFGDADFPVGKFDGGPKSYHDGWCRKFANKCRIRFQGPAMWVEGQGGIQNSQFIRFRYEFEGNEHYNYVSYKDLNGNRREALFLFSNFKAHREFLKAFVRWQKQESLPIPNFRYPNSQGPQDTHGRDKGLNPYENPDIGDWSIKTTEKGMRGKINCDSPVWKNRKVCQ